MLEPTMNSLGESFEVVAEWCEKQLEEQRGREIGMTFGAVLRTYGRLATLPSRLHGEQRASREGQLNAKAEKLLMEFSTRFYVAYEADSIRRKVQEPNLLGTNIAYDIGPRSQV
jgi:hypothetical protein